MIAKLKFKLENRFSKNEGGKLAVLKALEKLELLTRQNINPFSTTIFTESRITLPSLQTTKTSVHLWKKLENQLLVWREGNGR